MADAWTPVADSLALIRRTCAFSPEWGLVLGSGLGFLADEIESEAAWSYAELPGFPVSTVAGHAGRLLLGRLAGRPVAVMQGRFHYYEGYSLDQVVLGVRLMSRLGVRGFLITNAAGGIRADLKPGDLMLLKDHLNLFGHNPLRGPNPDALGPRFPDMSAAYSPALRAEASRLAQGMGFALPEGVYAGLSGPSYETPAEIRMLRTLGADAVGMSTVPEVIAANHLGGQVLGVSCISNLAAGLSAMPLSHAEVQETTQRVRDSFARLVRAWLAGLALEG